MRASAPDSSTTLHLVIHAFRASWATVLDVGCVPSELQVSRGNNTARAEYWVRTRWACSAITVAISVEIGTRASRFIFRL